MDGRQSQLQMTDMSTPSSSEDLNEVSSFLSVDADVKSSFGVSERICLRTGHQKRRYSTVHVKQ